MEAKHKTGGSMEIELSPDDIAQLRARRAVEATPTESGLRPFVVMEDHEFRGLAESRVFHEMLAIYVHKGFFTFEALRDAVSERTPIVSIPRNHIRTAYESSTNAWHLFGEGSEITLQLPESE